MSPIIAGTNSSTPSNYTWYMNDTLHTTIVYPPTMNKQRDLENFHSQCRYYDRGAEKYEQLRHMSVEEAQRVVIAEEAGVNATGKGVEIERCTQWEYDQEVMKNTIVTEWNLVCDDNFKRAHAHLFYCVGFLFGCLLGGFASDS